MTRVLQVLVFIPGLLFIINGLRFAVAPEPMLASLHMEMLNGLGRNSQIGDGGAFFLSMGLMILLGLVTTRKIWFQAVGMMLALTAMFRILSWLFHGAVLAPDLTIIEIVFAALMLVASSKLAKD